MFSPISIFKYLPRTLRMTKEGTRFILLTFAVGGAAINTGANLLYLLLAMMLSVIIVSGFLSEQSLRNVTVTVGPVPPLHAGCQGLIPLKLFNRKRRLFSYSLSAVALIKGAVISREAHFMSIPPQTVQTRLLQAAFAKRGCYRVEGLRLSTTFPFGLFVKSAGWEESMEVWVYPNVRPVSRPARSTAFPERSILSEQKGHGAGFNHFRDYLFGDDRRFIHWKLSARQRRLILKEREREEGREVTLFFGAPAPSEKPAGWEERFERGVETVASLAVSLIEDGFQVGLRTAGLDIDPDGGAAHLETLMKALALLQPADAVRAAVPTDGQALFVGLEEDPFWREKGSLFQGAILISSTGEANDLFR